MEDAKGFSRHTKVPLIASALKILQDKTKMYFLPSINEKENKKGSKKWSALSAHTETVYHPILLRLTYISCRLNYQHIPKTSPDSIALFDNIKSLRWCGCDSFDPFVTKFNVFLKVQPFLMGSQVLKTIILRLAGIRNLIKLSWDL